MAPEILHYADRKGWAIEPDQLSIEAVDHVRALGARYAVIADHRVIRDDVRRSLARQHLWQWEQVLIVRL